MSKNLSYMARLFSILIAITVLGVGCQPTARQNSVTPVRRPVDTVGFARYNWQLDSLITRIERYQGNRLAQALVDGDIHPETCWKVVITPHDDHAYAGFLYPALFPSLRAKTVIMFGVAHKARQLNLENIIVLGSHMAWQAPSGPIKISGMRDVILRDISPDICTINDSMMNIEHSLEAVVPYIQRYNPDAEILPVLVTAMDFPRMNEIGQRLAESVYKSMKAKNQVWGSDVALVISSDAVHYGDTDWGGKNYARFGTDSAGYRKAWLYEKEIIDSTLSGEITPEKIERFTKYTVEESDFRQYKWSWCGRYSIPLGLLVAYHLERKFNVRLSGRLVGYSTSIAMPAIPVSDLGMGLTAGASLHHWVGYAALGYE